MDLKNIDLKNINFDELISKIKTIEKKVLIKIGIGVGSVIFFLIIYYAVLNPIVQKKKTQLEYNYHLVLEIFLRRELFVENHNQQSILQQLQFLC